MPTPFELHRSDRQGVTVATKARRYAARYVLYAMLHVSGFVIVTLLMTWGVFVLFFLLIGSFSLDGVMQHLANISTRYVAADPARIDQFKLLVGVAHMGITATIVFFRRHAIVPPAAPAQGARS